ncbi:MAG: hypothetical protein AAF307_00185 [Pseudomonadota bacterium]
MVHPGAVVLIMGSGPNAVEARNWPKACFDQIVVINNAWRVRPDWDQLIFPEDFPLDRRPASIGKTQRLVEADAFVPAQNRHGGFVFAGATMAFTAAYWALVALRPRVMAFIGCDMVYAPQGATHFYGTGAPDPLRADVSLRDLGAKSARLALIARAQGCVCLNLSRDRSELLFPRADLADLSDTSAAVPFNIDGLRAQEDALGYATPTGRYDVSGASLDIAALDALDLAWRAAFEVVQLSEGTSS